MNTVTHVSPQSTHSTIPSLRQAVDIRRRNTMGPLILRTIVFLGVLGAAGWFGRDYFTHKGNKLDILTATVFKGDMPIVVSERGEIESSVAVVVRCEAEGDRVKIVKILPEGTPVKKDQEVVWLDSDLFQKELAKQEVVTRQLEGKAKAAKSKMEVAKNKAETEIDKADLALRLAKLDLRKYLEGDLVVEVQEKKGAIELARKDLKEAEDNMVVLRTMVAKGFKQMEELRRGELEVQTKKYNVSRDEGKLMVLETFDKERKSTEFQAKAKDAALELDRTRKSSQANIEESQSDLTAADDTLKLEMQTLDRLKRMLDKCVLKAPSDGIMVYHRYSPWDDTRIQAGAMIYPQAPIFSLPDMTKMQVKMNLHESVIKKVQPGQDAFLSIEALPNQTLRGKVKSVGTIAASQGWRAGSVKQYETIVEIVAIPEGVGIKPGMTADVRIDTKLIPDAVQVPVQCVSEREGRHYAYVVKGDGIERREIKVGEVNEKFIQILSGLEPKERVAQDARARVAADSKREQEEKQKKEATVEVGG